MNAQSNHILTTQFVYKILHFTEAVEAHCFFLTGIFFPHQREPALGSVSLNVRSSNSMMSQISCGCRTTTAGLNFMLDGKSVNGNFYFNLSII